MKHEKSKIDRFGGEQFVAVGRSDVETNVVGFEFARIELERLNANVYGHFAEWAFHYAKANVKRGLCAG